MRYGIRDTGYGMEPLGFQILCVGFASEVAWLGEA